MKNFISITIISLLLISLNCSSKSKIKTIPDDQHNWYLCTICKGTGTVTTLTAKDSADDVSDHPGNKYSFCIFPFIILAAFEDDTLNEETTEKAYNREYEFFYPDKNIEVMKERVPERSLVKRKTECPLCEGKGWIVGSPEDNSPVIIKKKNELTDEDFVNYK